MEIDKVDYPKISPKIVCREEEDEALLFDPENGSIRILNHLGYKIWSMCDGKHSIKQIIEKVKELHPSVSYGRIENDVRLFIQDLIKKGLLVEGE